MALCDSEICTQEILVEEKRPILTAAANLVYSPLAKSSAQYSLIQLLCEMIRIYQVVRAGLTNRVKLLQLTVFPRMFPVCARRKHLLQRQIFTSEKQKNSFPAGATKTRFWETMFTQHFLLCGRRGP